MGGAETRVLVVRRGDVAPFAGSKADLGLRVADELTAEL
jgi:hypothetical protein